MDYNGNNLGLSVRCVKTASCTKVNVDNSISVSVRIGNLIISDRNIGAPEGGAALNYTNDKNHTDHKNTLFKGGYYTWTEAQNACPHGWRLPTKTELTVIANAMQFSDGKAYLEDSSGNRCYFPLSGISSIPSYVRGYYWSSTEYSGCYGWNLYVATSYCRMSNLSKIPSLSVRCVKKVK